MTIAHRHSATNEQASGKQPAKPVEPLQLFAVVVFAVILVVALQRISIQQPLKPGDQAPVHTLESLSTGIAPRADLYHKPWAVLFFSAGCPHCKTELRNMEHLRHLFDGSVQFLLVTRSDRATTGALMDSLGIVIPVAVDEEGRVCEQFGVFKVPALFLINKNGTIQSASFVDQPFDVRKEQMESFLQTMAAETAEPVNLSR